MKGVGGRTVTPDVRIWNDLISWNPAVQKRLTINWSVISGQRWRHRFRTLAARPDDLSANLNYRQQRIEFSDCVVGTLEVEFVSVSVWSSTYQISTLRSGRISASRSMPPWCHSDCIPPRCVGTSEGRKMSSSHDGAPTACATHLWLPLAQLPASLVRSTPQGG